MTSTVFVRRCLAPALAAAGMAAMFAGEAAAAKPEPATRSAAGLRVMTWNIESARRYESGWANVIGNQKPDVAALQEVCHTGPSDKTKRIVAEVMLRYGIEYQPVYGLVPDAGVFGCTQFGNVLLVKKGIGIAQKGTVTYGRQITSDGGRKRSYAWANLRTPKGLVTVTSTHLQNGLKDAPARSVGVRRAQAAQLAQGVKRGAGRQIVMGDFNAGVNGPELKAFYAQRFADVDAACRAGKGCKATQDSGAKIDYILYRGFKASGFAVHGTPSSDHNVVVANLG